MTEENQDWIHYGEFGPDEYDDYEVTEGDDYPRQLPWGVYAPSEPPDDGDDEDEPDSEEDESMSARKGGGS